MGHASFDPRRILKSLVDHRVDFVVVGGVSAVLQGVPMTTQDLDIVYAPDAENIQRLLLALADLEAIYRDLGGRRIVPTTSHLAALGHNLFVTNAGAFDVLGYVGGTRTTRRYADLLPLTIQVEVPPGFAVFVLDLPTLIELKEEVNREKDRAVLPLLRSVLEARQENESRT